MVYTKLIHYTLGMQLVLLLIKNALLQITFDTKILSNISEIRDATLNKQTFIVLGSFTAFCVVWILPIIEDLVVTIKLLTVHCLAFGG